MYVKSLFVFLLFSDFSSANILTVPEWFEVLKVDGKTYSSDFFSTTQLIEMNDGKHVLLLKYKELFDDPENDDHTTIKSEPFLVMFSMQGQPLKVASKVNKDESEARVFAESPLVKLIDQNGKERQSTTMLLADFEQKQFQSALLNQAIDTPSLAKSEITNKNDSQQVVSKTSTKPIDTAKKQPVKSESKLQEPVSSPAYDMLIYWWKQADEQQKNAFMKQLNLKRIK